MQISLTLSEKVLEALPYSIILNDFKGNLIYANKIAYESRGYSEKEFMELNVDELDVKEKGRFFDERLNEILDNFETFFESAHYCKDGSIMQVKVHSQKIQFGDQECVMNIVEDITNSKLKEEKLKELNIQQQAILNNIPDKAWVKNTEEQFTAVNQALAAASGVDVPDMIGKTDLDFFPEEIAIKYRSDDRKVIKMRERVTIEEPFIDSTGKFSWIETIKTPIYDEKGKVIGTTGIARDVTQRKNIEEDLRESERRLRELADLLPVIAFEADLLGKLTYVNNLAFEMFGYTREEFLGQAIFSYIAPEDRDLSISNARRVLAGEYLGNNEYTAIKKDGSRLSVLIQTSPMRNSRGELIGSRGVLVDITRQKKIEAELRESEIKFRALFEQTQEGIVLLDDQGKVIGWNASQERLSGVKKEEALGKQLFENRLGIISTDDPQVSNRELMDSELIKLIKTKESRILNRVGESVVKKPNGDIATWLTITTLIDMGNKIMIGIFSMDITQRKRFEEALKESEEKYRSVFQNIKLGVFRTRPDARGQFLEANKAMEEITGYSRDELMNLDVVSLYPSQEERDTFVNRLLIDPEKATLSGHLMKKEGSRIDIYMIAKAIKDINGRLLYIDGTIEDITERKQLEKEIIDLYEKEKNNGRSLKKKLRPGVCLLIF